VSSWLKHGCKGSLSNVPTIDAAGRGHFGPVVIQLNWLVVAPTSCQQPIPGAGADIWRDAEHQETSGIGVGLQVDVEGNHAGGNG